MLRNRGCPCNPSPRPLAAYSEVFESLVSDQCTPPDLKTTSGPHHRQGTHDTMDRPSSCAGSVSGSAARHPRHSIPGGENVHQPRSDAPCSASHSGQRVSFDHEQTCHRRPHVGGRGNRILREDGVGQEPNTLRRRNMPWGTLITRPIDCVTIRRSPPRHVHTHTVQDSARRSQGCW